MKFRDRINLALADTLSPAAAIAKSRTGRLAVAGLTVLGITGMSMALSTVTLPTDTGPAAADIQNAITDQAFPALGLAVGAGAVSFGIKFCFHMVKSFL